MTTTGYRVRLECGHVHTQMPSIDGWWPVPRKGLESLCWEPGCLCFTPIVTVAKFDVAEGTTSP
jgi:hypothetical protein